MLHPLVTNPGLALGLELKGGHERDRDGRCKWLCDTFGDDYLKPLVYVTKRGHDYDVVVREHWWRPREWQTWRSELPDGLAVGGEPPDSADPSEWDSGTRSVFDAIRADVLRAQGQKEPSSELADAGVSAGNDSQAEPYATTKAAQGAASEDSASSSAQVPAGPKGGRRWLAGLLRALTNAAPEVSSGIALPDRRQPGQFSYAQDRRAYAGVHIYIEKGLADQSSLIRKVLDVVWQVQDRQVSEFGLRCHSFGPNGCERSNKGRGAVRNRQMATGRVSLLCQLSGATVPTGKSLISRLFPRVHQNDLVLFICRSVDSFLVGDEALRRLSKRRRRSFWVYLEDGDPAFETEAQRQRAARRQAKPATPPRPPQPAVAPAASGSRLIACHPRVFEIRRHQLMLTVGEGVSWRAGKLVYGGTDPSGGLYGFGDDLASGSEVTPSRQAWLVFWSQLDRLGVWNWKSDYINDNMLDGYEWSVDIVYGNRSVTSQGRNNEPSDFEAFREAVGQLLGVGSW
jgi:hypothetical protein